MCAHPKVKVVIAKTKKDRILFNTVKVKTPEGLLPIPLKK
jgi:hypothetical protein